MSSWSAAVNEEPTVGINQANDQKRPRLWENHLHILYKILMFAWAGSKPAVKMARSDWPLLAYCFHLYKKYPISDAKDILSLLLTPPVEANFDELTTLPSLIIGKPHFTLFIILTINHSKNRKTNKISKW
jgi:hypothetical protein